MAESKKIYLNGDFVGEYTPTGDNDTDIELCVRLLREKGLYPETTLQQGMFRQAVSFATTASYLYNRDLTKTPRNGLSVAPFVVNSAFALEIYLKTLGELHSARLRGHDLLELFDALPQEAHRALQQNFGKCKWQCGIAEMPDFRKALADMRHAFVEWRYLYEKERSSEVRFAPVIFVLEALHETCKALVQCKSTSQVQ